jgi:hypothetical protein
MIRSSKQETKAMVAIVDTKAAAMPQSCKGHYRIVRVLDVPYDKAALHQLGKWAPSSVRDKHVMRVIHDYGPKSVGKTARCGYQQAIAAAHELAAAYNNAGDQAEAEQLIGAGGSA